jgi:hypothetical protein
MKYFYNPDKKSTVAHIWVEGDTACRMLSTGGIKKGKKTVLSELDGRKVCSMCESNYKRDGEQ